MRCLILATVLGLTLSGCATAGSLPTKLPTSVTADDKAGIAVETAYEAAALAERTLVEAQLVTPAQAATLVDLDQQAYRYVCYTRTAYDVANGFDPSKRNDHCPTATKIAGGLPSYADAARDAIELTRQMVTTMVQYRAIK